MVISDAARAFLDRPLTAVLATTSAKGRSQATPIWYMMDGDRIVINTSVGRVKLRNLEANPYLALTVVDPQNAYRYVQVQGKVVRFDRENGARDINRLSLRYTGKSYGYPGGQRPEDRVTVVIRPLRVSSLRP